MTFSFNERLYSMMTVQLFSSMPCESIRPPWVFPVTYSDARKRMPKKASKCFSKSVWIDFSTAAERPSNSRTPVLLPTRKSLMSLIEVSAASVYGVRERCGNFAKRGKCRFKVIHDLLRQHVRWRQVVEVVQTFVLEPEDVEAGLV